MRPYATAGIAIAGASVIAVTPITAPPPDAQTRSVELSAAVQNLETPDVSAGAMPPELTAAYAFDAIAPIVSNPTPINGALENLVLARKAIAEALGATGSPGLQGVSADTGTQALAPPDLGIVFDPIAQWADIFTTAFGNVAWIGEQWLADPATFLRQALMNQIGYATMVADTMGSVIPTTLSALFDPSYPNGFASGLVKAFELARANDFIGASNALFSGLIGTAFGLFPMADLLQIPVQMSANLNNVLETAASLPISLGFAAISAVGMAFQSTGTSAQAISDALTEGDTAAALSALIAAPGNITDAVLNGGQFGGGLLSNNGIIARLVVDVPRMLADAITPEAASPSKVEPEKTVTLTVEPQAEPEAAAPEAAETVSAESDSADGTDGDDGTDGNKVTPGESTGTPKHRKPTKLSTTLKNISEDVDKTVAKVTDGVKKALGGNKSEPKKNDEKSGADDDAKGDNDSDGSGASG
ncbi:hypothetical protein AFM11_16710 [Mycolicibacterium wolinskyi]|uniref:PE-PGRS family protein n=1 Tax=Mycolicibacterium wolinskyi TaxID=59750 RepID=A0A132PLX2_9MYCO|nr:hypothetical protein AFM11_16710 [Mycolicibacterium wolinskyi]